MKMIRNYLESSAKWWIDYRESDIGLTLSVRLKFRLQ